MERDDGNEHKRRRTQSHADKSSSDLDSGETEANSTDERIVQEYKKRITNEDATQSITDGHARREGDCTMNGDRVPIFFRGREDWIDLNDYKIFEAIMSAMGVHGDEKIKESILDRADFASSNPMTISALRLNRAELMGIPEEIGNLKGLTSLDLSNSGIMSLPGSIGQLTCLKSLDLSKTRNLSSLPEEIGNLNRLICLDLHESGITALPGSVGQLTSLKSLRLWKTKKLSGLPEEIGNLKRLTFLNLRESGIMALPESIGQLKKLDVLTLKNTTKLLHLPVEIGDLRFVTIFIHIDSWSDGNNTTDKVGSEGFWYEVLSRRARVIGPNELSPINEKFTGIRLRLLPFLLTKARNVFKKPRMYYCPKLEGSESDGIYHFLAHHREMLIALHRRRSN